MYWTKLYAYIYIVYYIVKLNVKMHNLQWLTVSSLLNLLIIQQTTIVCQDFLWTILSKIWLYCKRLVLSGKTIPHIGLLKASEATYLRRCALVLCKLFSSHNRVLRITYNCHHKVLNWVVFRQHVYIVRNELFMVFFKCLIQNMQCCTTCIVDSIAICSSLDQI